MQDQTKGNLIGLLFVALVAAIGVYIIYIGLGKFGRGVNDAPGWVMVAAGAAFLFAAASMGLSAIGGIFFGASANRDGSLNESAPKAIRGAQMLLSLGVVAMLATVATWVAFNPGEASGTGSNVAFAAGAVLIWGALLGFAIWRIRRLS
jgi:hypothetical protein